MEDSWLFASCPFGRRQTTPLPFSVDYFRFDLLHQTKAGSRFLSAPSRRRSACPLRVVCTHSLSGRKYDFRSKILFPSFLHGRSAQPLRKNLRSAEGGIACFVTFP